MIKYWQAINRALVDALKADDRVIIFGEDVAEPGGAFGSTRGLLEQFGDMRVRDTPISEAVIVGSAVGAAMTGLRPIVEVMFMDFVGLAMDQIVNQAAKVSYMSGGKYHVPMVVRTVCGAGRNTGPQHSQSFEGWLANVPGLKVVWPSCPSDAYGLLRSAIDDEDPVIVIESLRHWGMREDVSKLAPVPLGQAAIRRPGDDVTVVAWGGAVDRVSASAESCAAEGIRVEVIDMRTVSPLDETSVLNSLEKTRRLVIVEDGPGHVGIGSRLAALVASRGLGLTRSPVAHVSSPFAPVPFPPTLEDAYYPDVETITQAIFASMEYSK